jgi:hypothetical protein
MDGTGHKIRRRSRSADLGIPCFGPSEGYAENQRKYCFENAQGSFHCGISSEGYRLPCTVLRSRPPRSIVRRDLRTPELCRFDALVCRMHFPRCSSISFVERRKTNVPDSPGFLLKAKTRLAATCRSHITVNDTADLQPYSLQGGLSREPNSPALVLIPLQSVVLSLDRKDRVAEVHPKSRCAVSW